MTTWILAVLGLFVVQTLMPALIRSAANSDAKASMTEALGPRDNPTPLPTSGERAVRAAANMQEALPVFLTLALLAVFKGGETAATASTGAMIFFAARLVYVPLYVGGVPIVRSLAWTGGWVGLVMMLLPIVKALP